MLELQQEFNFTYPDLFLKLYNNNMLTPKPVTFQKPIEEFEISTAGSIHNSLKHQNGVPEFLCNDDNFRLIDADKIRYLLTKSFIGENIDPKHKFIPFGVDYANYWFAFSFNQEEYNNVPIVLVWSDCDTATVLTKNLQDFIFYEMLAQATYLGQIDNDTEKYTDFEQKRKQLIDMLLSHAKYMKPEHVEIIKEIYTRPLITKYNKPSQTYEYTSYMLIDKSEAHQIEENTIGNFSLYKHQFNYMKPM